MSYYNDVLKHFNFSSDMSLNIKNKTKYLIRISGKVTKRTFVFYALTVLLFMLGSFSEISNNKVGVIDISSLNIIMNIILPIVVMGIVYIKSKLLFKKMEPSVKNVNIYQRELPSKLRPAHVRMLLTDGQIDSISLAATLLDLIDNGYIELSKNRDKLEVFGDEEIILTKTDKNQEGLFKYEQFLIKWFIDSCGNGREVSNTQIKAALANTTYANSPNKYFEHFQALVIISFPLKKYYDELNIDNQKYRNNNRSNIIWVVFSFLLIPLYLFPSVFAYNLGMLMFIRESRYVLNQEGVDELDSWLDLKKYLTDFSTIEDKSAEMVAIWKFYLTYSIVLEINDKVSQELQDFCGDQIYYCPPVSSAEEAQLKNEELRQLRNRF